MSPRPTGSANCCTPGCTNPIHFKGLCKEHYARGRTKEGRYQGYRILEVPKSPHCGITGCTEPLLERELCTEHFRACYPQDWLKRQEVKPQTLPASGLVQATKKVVQVPPEPMKAPEAKLLGKPKRVSAFPSVGSFEEEEFEAHLRAKKVKEPKRYCQKCKKLLTNGRRNHCGECEPKGKLWQNDGNWVYT